MATLKQRLHRKNSSGSYDVIHLETSASCVLLSSGTTVESKISSMETAISSKAPSSHNHAASNITSGTLGTARGGTGITSNPSMLVNLGSTAAASVFATSPRPGVTGTLPAAYGGTGVTSLDALKNSLGISSGGGTASSLTKPSVGAVGSTVSWAGYTWRVVHNDGKLVYLMTDAILELIQFSSNSENNAYLGSKIHQRCLKFAADADITNCDFVADIMGGKVFIAGYDQVNGEFSYFSSDSNRIAKYNGNIQHWWTSSSSGGSDRAWSVHADGSVYPYYSPNAAIGFRPCVALKL